MKYRLTEFFFDHCYLIIFGMWFVSAVIDVYLNRSGWACIDGLMAGFYFSQYRRERMS